MFPRLCNRIFPFLQVTSMGFSLWPTQGPAEQFPSSMRNTAPWVAQTIMLLSRVKKFLFFQFNGVPICGQSLKYPNTTSPLRTTKNSMSSSSAACKKPRLSPSAISSRRQRTIVTVLFHPSRKLVSIRHLQLVALKAGIDERGLGFAVVVPI